MSSKQFALTLVVVAVAGLIGGAVSDRLEGTPAYAQAGGQQVITAQEFRLVDQSGRTLAMLGSSPYTATLDELDAWWKAAGKPREAGAGGEATVAEIQRLWERAGGAALREAKLWLLDPNGTVRASFTRRYIDFGDETGRATWSAPVDLGGVNLPTGRH